MTALLTLGLRLIRAGGALRVGSVVLGCALAVALLCTAWALPDALYPVLDPQNVDMRRGPLVGLLVCITVPLLALVFTVGRLSSQVRDRRLASLRLIGVPRRATAGVAVVENLVPSALGAVLGIVGAIALCAALTSVLGERVVASLTIRPDHAAVVGAGVVALSVALSLAPLRRIGSPRSGHSAAVVRRPSPWRLVLLLPCIAAFTVLLTVPAAELGDWLTSLYLIALVSGGLAVVLTTPLVSFAAAAGLTRSGRTDLLLAARGIQTQAAPIGRRVVALGLAVYVVVGGAGMLSVYEGVTYLRASIHQMEVGPQEIWVGPVSTDGTAAAPALLGELAEVDGVQAVVPRYDLSPTACDAGSAVTVCPQVFVGTCASLSAVMVETGCRDDRPAWIDSDLSAFPEMVIPLRVASLAVSGPDGEAHTIQLGDATITQDVPATTERWVWPGQAQVFVPASLAQSWGIGPYAADVVAEVGAGVRERVRAVAAPHGFYADATYLYDYDSVVATRTTVWVILAVAIGTALLAYGLATIDRARERRRPRARLVALGVSAGLLRRVDGVQNLIPLLTTIVLAAALGTVHTAAYSHAADQPFSISPLLVATLIGLVVLGAVLVSCATMPLTRARIRARDLRDD